MPRSFVDITFSSSGTNAVAVARRLQSLASVLFITGEHDLYFDWHDETEFESRIRAIHDALAGTGASYRVHTSAERTFATEPKAWPPTTEEVPAENPAFPSKRRVPPTERIR